MPTPYRAALLRLFSAGVIGWAERSSTAYMIYAMLHNLTMTVTRLAGGSVREPRSYDTLYPLQAELQRLGVDRLTASVMRWTAANRGR